MPLSPAVMAVLLAAAGSGGVATRLPPAPARVWEVAWQRQLVTAEPMEWKPQELGGPAVDPLTGLVVVGTRDGWLHARNPTGTRVWEFKTRGRFDAQPRIEDGDTVYVGSSDGKLYALSLDQRQAALDLRRRARRWAPRPPWAAAWCW